MVSRSLEHQLAVLVLGDVLGGRERLLGERARLLGVAGDRMPAGERLVGEREIPVADAVLLADVEAALRVVQARLGCGRARRTPASTAIRRGRGWPACRSAAPQWCRDACAMCSIASSSSRVRSSFSSSVQVALNSAAARRRSSVDVDGSVSGIGCSSPSVVGGRGVQLPLDAGQPGVEPAALGGQHRRRARRRRSRRGGRPRAARRRCAAAAMRRAALELVAARTSGSRRRRPAGRSRPMRS